MKAETMANPIRIGVLGAGSIGLRGALAHLAVGRHADRVVPGAVCDTVPGCAKAAEKYGVRQWFAHDEILANGHIDAVTLSAHRDLRSEGGPECQDLTAGGSLLRRGCSSC
jgi:predicted dehydrogenase